MNQFKHRIPQVPETPMHTALQIIFSGEATLDLMPSRELFILAKKLRVTHTAWYTEIVNSFSALDKESFPRLTERLRVAIGNEAVNMVGGTLAKVALQDLRRLVFSAPEPDSENTDEPSECEGCRRPEDECVCDDAEAKTKCPGCGKLVCTCEEDRCKLCGMNPCVCGGGDTGPEDPDGPESEEA